MNSNRREFLVRTGQGLGALTLSGALAGCGGLTGDSGSGGGGSGALSFGGTAEERKPLEAILADWDGAEVRPRFTEVTQFNNALRTQLGSGSAPDVFRAAPGSGAPVAVQQIAPQGFLADLSDAPWAANVIDTIKPLVQTDGKTYALPVTVTSIGAFYNRPAFERAGVEPPATLDDFLAACASLKRAGVTPMALGLGTPTTGQFLTYALVASAVYAQDPEFDAKLAAGDATFAGSGWQDALETMVRLVDEGYVTRNPNGTSLDVALQQTAKGEAAMMVLPGVVSPALAAAGSAEDIAAFPVPGTSEADTRIPASPSDTFAVNAKAGDVDAAREFVDFVAQDAQIQAFAQTAACTPGLTVDGFEADPAQAPLEALVADGRSVPFMNHRWPNPDVQQVLLAGVQELVGGRTTPADLLAELDKAYAGS